jgi:pyruvate ferredoxin oxidoreductase gamma subunit
MFEIRIHGRGGQGVVTAAELLSVAAFREGRHAQAFPSFGSERTGAPVVSFCRIDDRMIRLREPIQQPDAVIIADPSLLHQVDVLAGLRSDGYLLVNSGKTWGELGLAEVAARLPVGHSALVPATGLAQEHVGRPVPNAGLLGGFAAMSGLMSLEAVRHAIEERFGARIAAGNVTAARAAFDLVIVQIGQIKSVEVDHA